MRKEAMKRFLIETSVENAEGSQTWYVDATSEDEALKKYEQGRCDLYASNVDVTSLGEPEISGETTLDDFGDFAEQPAQHQGPYSAPVKELWPVAKPWVGLTKQDLESAYWDYMETGTQNGFEKIVKALEIKLRGATHEDRN